MKRVAYLTPVHVADPASLDRNDCYPRTLAKAVAGTGECEVEIVACGDVEAVGVSPLTDRVTLRLLPAANGGTGTEPLSWELFAALRDADVVHIHEIFTRPSEVGALVAKLLDKPVCATDHGGGSSGLGRSLGMLELIDRVICHSDFERSLISTSAPVSVVLGCVDDEYFVPPTEPAARDRLLFAGRLLPGNGVDRLLDALPRDVPLTICAPTAESEYVDRLHELSRSKEVEFVSAANEADLRTLYERAFGVVLPAVYVDCYGDVHDGPDLAGSALLQGMACGAPAICSRVGGMPEFVEHGRSGFIFNDPAELIEYIDRLASDDSLVYSMGSNARRRVEEGFGLSRTGAAMMSIYADLPTRVPIA